MLFFLHIPKSGGTSFFSYLCDNFRSDEIFNYRWLEQQGGEGLRLWRAGSLMDGSSLPFLGRLIADRKLIVDNHFDFSIIQYLRSTGRDVQTVTILRDPIERVVSLYRHWRRIEHFYYTSVDAETAYAYSLARDYGLAEFLEKAQGIGAFQKAFDNAQARQLAGVSNSHPSDSCVLSKAISNITQIEFVGTLEQVSITVAELSDAMGWPRSSTPSYLNADASVDPKHRPALRSLVPHSLVDLDWQLYRIAQARAVTASVRSLDVLPDVLESGAFSLSMDAALYGTGWHARDYYGNNGCRWAGPGLYSDVWFRCRPGRAFRFEVWFVSIISAEVFATLRVQFNGVDVPLHTEVRGTYTVGVGFVDASSNSGALGILSFRTEIVQSSAELIGSSDHRLVSVAIERIVFTVG